MASKSRDKKGNYTFQFMLEGRRRSLRMGKMPERDAVAFNRRVEDLLAAKLTAGSFSPDLAAWVSSLPEETYDRLVRVGLVEPRKRGGRKRVAEWVREYIAGRGDAKDSTLCNMWQAARSLVEYLGEEKLLGELTAADGEGYACFLRQRLSEATVRRQCGRAKQFLNAAVRARLLKRNPWSSLRSADCSNRKRDHEVRPETVERLLRACPDAEWRVIVALAYYAGLRTPSETLAVRWVDVDWADKWLRVHASKTARESGGGVRDVPICPAMEKVLLEAHGEASEGAEYVITRYRSGRANLRTQFLRIARRAGVETFPKPFQNMRATCETNWLAAGVPECQVSEWIGHKVGVGRRHYHQQRAEWAERIKRGAAESAARALQNPMQQQSAQECTEKNGEPQVSQSQELCTSMQMAAAECASVQQPESPHLQPSS